MLSYFGCDQSQVQRYLTARSLDEARSSLFMTAYWKIPLQVLVLIVGVLTFRSIVFHQPPMLFNPVHERAVKVSAQAPQYAALEADFQRAFDARLTAAQAVGRGGDRRIRRRARQAARRRSASVSARVHDDHEPGRELTREAAHDASYSDVNYVFPTFITTALPIGLVGLWIVAIITAATDTIAAELNSLATATVIDFYQRLYQAEGLRRRLPSRLEDRDRALGRLRLHRRCLCQQPRIADRGRQPVRVVLLRLDSWRVPARHFDAARDRHRRFHRPDRGYGRRRRRRVPCAPTFRSSGTTSSAPSSYFSSASLCVPLGPSNPTNPQHDPTDQPDQPEST